MNLNPNSNSSGQNPVNLRAPKMVKPLGVSSFGALGAAGLVPRVPFAPHNVRPKMMPSENNPIKNAFRDSLSKMSPEAARELLMQRRESLGGLLGGALSSLAKQN